ncbi:MAG: hypothetical protein QOH28_3680 [Actinomycetota bacterium]|nr:hypothetical protein [Actinomycetota bacterium]
MLRACAGTAAVLVVPGAVVAWLLRLRFRTLATWAAIPAFSLATVFVVAEAVDLVGLSFDVATVSVVVGALAALAFARRHRTRRAELLADAIDETRSRGVADDSRDVVAKRIALSLLLLAIAGGILIWVRGVDGHALVPPEVDASNHGFFVARVLDSSSVDVSKVVVSDATGTYRSASFYPLGAHASAAVAVRVAGADVGRVLLVFDIVFASVVLPLGMFVLARMLARDAPLVAGFTALAVPALVLFPYGSIGYGDVPLVMGMALVPITVVVAMSVLTTEEEGARRPSVESVIAAGILLFAAIVVHTSQLPLILVLVGLLVLERAWRARSARILRTCLVPGLGVGVVVVVLFAPTLRMLVTGVSERSSIFLTTHLSVRSAVGRILSLQIPQSPTPQVLLAVLALVGVAVRVWHRRPAWVIGYALVLGVTLLVWVSNGSLSNAVGLPWYHSSARLSFNQAFFVPFFAGVALAFLVDGVSRLGKANALNRLVVASVLVALVFSTTVGYHGYRASTRLLRRSFKVDARVTHESEAAFAWLREHSSRSDVVVNDVNADGSLWMYALEGLHPLFAVGPIFSDRAAVADWNDRKYLVEHINQLGIDRHTDELVRRYDARWVYFDEQLFSLFHHTMRLDALRRNGRLQLAFERGTVHVFRIVDPSAPASN